MVKVNMNSNFHYNLKLQIDAQLQILIKEKTTCFIYGQVMYLQILTIVNLRLLGKVAKKLS